MGAWDVRWGGGFVLFVGFVADHEKKCQSCLDFTVPGNAQDFVDNLRVVFFYSC